MHTTALVFGDISDPNSKVSEFAQNSRRFKLLEKLGTDTNVIYLKKVDTEAKVSAHVA